MLLSLNKEIGNRKTELEEIMRHLIDPLDFSVEEIDSLLKLADDIAQNPKKYQSVCAHKKLATLFYEPSTRTRLSFEAAMLNLGGSVLGFSSADSSSASKGESIADTIRVISGYADIFDVKIFFKTIGNVLTGKDVVEGGTQGR